MIMKRILALLLGAALLLSFAGCAHSYPETAQTEKEKTAVFTLGSDTVTYDHFRAEFLRLKTKDDMGNASYWDGLSAEQKATVFEKYKDGALAEIARLYAVFALCRENGIDPYGATANGKVREQVNAGIDSLGVENPYQTYLDTLEETYLTDYVYRLLVRERVCEELLAEKLNERDGVLYPENETELTDYLMSDQTACVIWMPGSPSAAVRIQTRGIKKIPWRAMERKVAGPVRPMVWSIIWLMTVQLRKKNVMH